LLKKALILGIIFLFIGMSVASSTIPNAMKQSNLPPGQILYVGGTGPGNYSCINDAIDNTSNGDTVFVYNGTYNETVIIDKSIVLQGENKHSTIINGLRKNDTVTITTSKVTVAGFTITNSSYDMKAGLWWKAGVRILDSHNIIRDNIISNNRLGIFGKQASNLTIVNNTFENDGITLYPYDTGYHTRPTLSKKHFVHTIDNNTVNGNPLLYYVDKSDFEVPSKIGQLIAVNCTNMTVRNVSINNADFMGLMVFCSHCVVEDSRFAESNGAFTLLASDNNIIRNNTMSHNLHGLLLDYYSTNNQISHNHFLENQYCGVICEYFSNHNCICHNNFIENRNENAFLIQSFSNRWKENYWNDWIGFRFRFLGFLPKIISGILFEQVYSPLPINLDWHPAGEPYQIE